MRKLILRLSVSIDGFIEGAAGQKLDFGKSRSPEGAALVAEKMGHGGAHLLGRKSFCQMASFWPTASGTAAEHMNTIPKIVFSRKGFDPAEVTDAAGWANAQVITDDFTTALAVLKQQPGKDLIAQGGIEFAQNLVATGLVDEYWLAMHPVAAGQGAGLFEKLAQPLYLKLIETTAFSTGAMMHVYQPE